MVQGGTGGVAQTQAADDHVERAVEAVQPEPGERDFTFGEQARHQEFVAKFDFVDVGARAKMPAPPQAEHAHRRRAEIQLFDAQSAVEDAQDQLAFLMGRESGVAFDVATEIPKAVGDPIPADEAVATALDKRLDLQSARAAAAEAERAVSYSRNQLLPQVFPRTFRLAT